MPPAMGLSITPALELDGTSESTDMARGGRLFDLTKSFRTLLGVPRRSSIRVHVDKADANTPDTGDSPLLSDEFDDSLASSGTRTPSDDECRTTSLRNTLMLVRDRPMVGDGAVRLAAGHRARARAADDGSCSASKDNYARGRPNTHVLDRVGRKLSPTRTADGARGTGAADARPHSHASNGAAIRAANGAEAAASTGTRDTGGAPPVRAPERIRVKMHDSERNFILSLTDVDDPDGAASCSPLLGSDPRPERFGPLAGPYSADGADAGSSCVVPLGPKKTLVLDLDETLVASTRKPVPSDFKIKFRIHNEVERADPEQGSTNGEEVTYYVRIRPGLAKFLAEVTDVFEIVVWTASGKAYADAILDFLDPEGRIFSKRLYRHSCVRHRGLCVKDLRRLGRPMSSVVLLDNFVYSFGFTLDNGLPIPPWTGTEGPSESGLSMASAILQKLAQTSDVRSPLIKIFDMHRVVHGERPTSVSPRVPPASPKDDAGTPRSRHSSRGRSGCNSRTVSWWPKGYTVEGAKGSPRWRPLRGRAASPVRGGRRASSLPRMPDPIEECAQLME